ncbi:hypothetical protein [Blautia wexlerae]|uniref:hypothetical protein n=1 Tax=Blautia wexlerae TaxID=418240 RepID=UPI001A9B783B|nr:hypothetical protein [Blautia wexlerae]
MRKINIFWGLDTSLCEESASNTPATDSEDTLELHNGTSQAAFVGANLWARAKAACFVIHEREDRT